MDYLNKLKEKYNKVIDLDYLYKNFNLEMIEEDYGRNGLDYVKGLSVEELNEEFEDYKLVVEK